MTPSCRPAYRQIQMPSMTTHVPPPDDGGDGDGDGDGDAPVGVGDGVPDGSGPADLLGLAGAGWEADGGAGVAVLRPGGVLANRPATTVARGVGTVL
jgi:hypothetical protein